MFAGGGKEAEDLIIVLVGDFHVKVTAFARYDQVITVGGGGDGDFFLAGLDELQNRHLSGGVLHGDPVRAKHDEALATDIRFNIAVIVQVREQNLLAESKPATQLLAVTTKL